MRLKNILTKLAVISQHRTEVLKVTYTMYNLHIATLCVCVRVCVHEVIEYVLYTG